MIYNANQRDRISLQNPFEEIPYSIEVSLINSAQKQVLFSQATIKSGKTSERFEKTFPADSHMEVFIHGESVYAVGYLDISITHCSMQIKVNDYNPDTGEISLTLQSKIGKTTTKESIVIQPGKLLS